METSAGEQPWRDVLLPAPQRTSQLQETSSRSTFPSKQPHHPQKSQGIVVGVSWNVGCGKSLDFPLGEEQGEILEHSSRNQEFSSGAWPTPAVLPAHAQELKMPGFGADPTPDLAPVVAGRWEAVQEHHDVRAAHGAAGICGDSGTPRAQPFPKFLPSRTGTESIPPGIHLSLCSPETRMGLSPTTASLRKPHQLRDQPRD